MKKLIPILMGFTLLFAINGCSNNKNQDSSMSQGDDSLAASQTDRKEQERQGASDTKKSAVKSLVVYFSWSGNTENVAESIQKQSDADMFEIIPEIPYSEDYDTVVDLAQEEQRNHARPKIDGHIENIADYDVIYVGFPNWWGDMPMILYTFFDDYDLSGKTIAPFCTSGGSGLSNTVNEIKKLEPDAAVTQGLHIGSSSASDSDQAVKNWLSEIGFVK